MALPSLSEYVATVVGSAEDYSGFNLLLIDALAGEAVCVTNMEAKAPLVVTPGVHGLTNQTLDDPWPKVLAGKAMLEKLLLRPHAPPSAGSLGGGGGSATAAAAASGSSPRLGANLPPGELAELLLRELLNDRSRFPDTELPQTGCDLELERHLSSTFVTYPERNYGTRAQTIVLVDVDGVCTFVERAMDSLPAEWSTRSFTFQMVAP